MEELTDDRKLTEAASGGSYMGDDGGGERNKKNTKNEDRGKISA